MTPPQTIPINEIKVEERQRVDLGDLADLAASLKQFGLIQPIIINQDRRLVAGGRRLAAARQLGWESIPCSYRETLSADELHELELEENIRRKDMSWWEEVLGICQIHNLRMRRAAQDGGDWSLRRSGELLGVHFTHVRYMLELGKRLRPELGPDNKPIPTAKYLKCENASDAWRLIMRDEDDRIKAELARRQALASQTNIPTTLADPFADFTQEPQDSTVPTAFIKPYTSLTYEEAKQRYLSNPLNDPEEFDHYYKERQSRIEELQNTVFVSNMLFRGDAIEFMCRDENAGRFDHVITDIPYGIDVENMAQDFGGLVDIDTVAEEHDVEYNKRLIASFYPAAFRCTKDLAFVITWADQMLWQFMYDCAVKAGFSVQRWPITWKKTHPCKNSCANFNTTKDTEIAIVARKPRTTVAWQPNTSVVIASNEVAKERYGHPFAKPHECWEYCIKLASLEHQTILEPFAGRGSGVVPMLELNRHVVAVELNEQHYNSLLENVKQYYLALNPNFTFK